MDTSSVGLVPMFIKSSISSLLDPVPSCAMYLDWFPTMESFRGVFSGLLPICQSSDLEFLFFHPATSIPFRVACSIPNPSYQFFEFAPS